MPDGVAPMTHLKASDWFLIAGIVWVCLLSLTMALR